MIDTSFDDSKVISNKFDVARLFMDMEKADNIMDNYNKKHDVGDVIEALNIYGGIINAKISDCVLSSSHGYDNNALEKLHEFIGIAYQKSADIYSQLYIPILDWHLEHDPYDSGTFIYKTYEEYLYDKLYLLYFGATFCYKEGSYERKECERKADAAHEQINRIHRQRKISGFVGFIVKLLIVAGIVFLTYKIIQFAGGIANIGLFILKAVGIFIGIKLFIKLVKLFLKWFGPWLNQNIEVHEYETQRGLFFDSTYDKGAVFEGKRWKYYVGNIIGWIIIILILLSGHFA